MKGTAFVYAGQEKMLSHLPSIFQKDTTDFTGGEDISELIAGCARIKKTELAADGVYGSFADDGRDVAYLWCRMGQKCVMGIFSLRGYQGELPAYMADGTYENLLTEKTVSVSEGHLVHDGNPIIVKLHTDCFLEKEMRIISENNR